MQEVAVNKNNQSGAKIHDTQEAKFPGILNLPIWHRLKNLKMLQKD